MEHRDEYHGIVVADPFRWLEDTDSERTRDWVAAQNEQTFDFLRSIPERNEISRRLTELWDYPRYGVPIHRGGRYFFTKNTGLQNQAAIYCLDDLDGEPRLLLDPNQLSEDGTVALSEIAVSREGSHMAFGVTSGGSDWTEWRVIDVATGAELPDVIRWVKFSSATWRRDGSGFFYSRYSEPLQGEELAGVNYYQKLYFHRLGTSQDDDELVYERPDQREWGFDGQVSHDGRWLVIHIWQGTDRRNRIYLKDLEGNGSEVVPLLDEFDASYRLVGNDGAVFFLLTDSDAPRGRLVAIDSRDPRRSAWREVIAERRETLETVRWVGSSYVAHYLRDAHSQVRLFDLDGTPRGEVPLPGIGTVVELTGEPDDPRAFYGFTGFTMPTTVYRFDVDTRQQQVFRKPQVAFRPEDYVTQQIFYRSEDGTRVPMFVTHLRSIRLDGSNPALLQGYGGFNISLTPSFSVSNLVWMERGGISAVANLRGGGEYGQDWHRAGTRLAKQNVFDDFRAAARWLIDRGYTRPDRLAATGRSNGGLLVAAALTQEPELFGAMLIHVGVLDMLRFHKFTIGWAWISDYGSPDDPEEFQALYAYSPYHNLETGTHYPATLVTTADHDDRVVPAHSYKFTAALQAAQGGDAPVLIRVETRAGHGAGKPTSKLIAEAGDSLSFLVEALEIGRGSQQKDLSQGGAGSSPNAYGRAASSTDPGC